MIEKTKTGTIIATGNGIRVVQLAALVSGLKLEINCPGMRMSRHITALQAAKAITKLKTNDRKKHLVIAESMLEEAKAQTAYVSDESPTHCPGCGAPLRGDSHHCIDPDEEGHLDPMK